MLVFIDKVGAVIANIQAWFLVQPLPLQIAVGTAALVVVWFLWIVLRVTLVPCARRSRL